MSYKMTFLLDKLIVGFVIFVYTFLNFLVDMFKVFFFGFRSHGHIKRILIFRVGNIGDIICSVPAMVAIRNNYPDANITLMSSPGRYGMPGAKELLSGAEFLDDLIIYYQENINNLKGMLGLIKKLRKEKVDLFIELPQNLEKFTTLLRNIIFAKIIGCKYAFGFRVSSIKLFKQIQSGYLKFDNEVERLLKILEKENLKIGKVNFPLPIFEEDKRAVKEFLKSSEEATLIALNPNAKRQTNLWPIDRFAELGRWLVENYNVGILIIGGKGDTNRAEKLQGMIGKGVINTAGRFSLLQTLELLRHCQLLISNDTGVVHMASAVGTLIIDISSARDFKNKWFPYGEKNIILRKEPKCHTCFFERCEHLACLKMINVEEVCKAATQILKN